MNQQFRKLALETDAYCDQHYPNHPHYDILWEQKFAELIVRECISIVGTSVDQREPASTYVGKIKQHFGVE